MNPAASNRSNKTVRELAKFCSKNCFEAVFSKVASESSYNKLTKSTELEHEILSNDSLCKDLLGFSSATVKQIACDNFTLIRKIIGQKLNWSVHKALIFFLIYLRQYFVDRVLAWIFEISDTTVNRLKNEFVQAFADLGILYFKFPDREMRLKNSKEFRGKTIIMVIDGFEQGCVKFCDKELELQCHSGKKKKSTITKLVGCDPATGKIMWWSNSYPGSTSDAGMLILERNGIPPLCEGECIMADKGFNNLCTLLGKNHIIPNICNPGKCLSENEEKINDMIASVRIIIENHICQLKKMKVLSDKFRVKDSIQKMLIAHDNHCLAVFYLIDKYKLPRGIRSN